MLQQVQRSSWPSGVTIPDSPPVPRSRPTRATMRLWLQQSLNALGANPPLAEDGVYGPLTMAAVQQFQQANGLSPSGVADAATIAAIERKLRPTVPGPIPSGPTDLIALLERLVMLIEKLKGMRPMMDPSSGLSPTDRLRKTLDLLSAILSPGAAGKTQPLGQVNGALGQTIGNLLDGKKTAIGLLGAVATPLLSQSVRDRHARPAARHADAGRRPERLRPAGLPRPHRLGRARQDGEMGARNSAAAADL